MTFITLNQREEHHLTTSSVNLNFTGLGDIVATMRAVRFLKDADSMTRWASCAKALFMPDTDCCENESRNMNGGCDNCGDPCL